MATYQYEISPEDGNAYINIVPMNDGGEVKARRDLMVTLVSSYHGLVVEAKTPSEVWEATEDHLLKVASASHADLAELRFPADDILPVLDLSDPDTLIDKNTSVELYSAPDEPLVLAGTSPRETLKELNGSWPEVEDAIKNYGSHINFVTEGVAVPSGYTFMSLGHVPPARLEFKEGCRTAPFYSYTPVVSILGGNNPIRQDVFDRQFSENKAA